MKEEFAASLIPAFERQNYLVQPDPNLAGVRGLLYVHAPHSVRLAFARVLDHFLFVDWDNDLFGRLDQLIETHRKFSDFINKGFKVPRVWRMTIPNLVTIAVANTSYPAEAVDAVNHKYMIPWQGGEIGQLMLVELPEGKLYHHVPPGYKQTGSMPILHAENVIKSSLREARGER